MESRSSRAAITTGYGTDNHGHRHCFGCCAKIDARRLHRDGRATMYLCKTATGAYEVTNWPGTLRFPAVVSVGRHNLAGVRYDAWFNSQGHGYHGVTYGDFTQLCHVRRVKA